MVTGAVAHPVAEFQHLQPKRTGSVNKLYSLKEKSMKVVAINGSPKMDKGTTALILDPFLDGLRGSGAEVELFYTKKLKINPCQGDFRCSTDTPGKCFQKDDMQMLHPKLCEADIWMMATPVYVSGMAGPLKNLIDRILIPLGEPQLELRDGHCHHPLRKEVKSGKVVPVSTCAYWELDNFDLLLAHMRAFSEHAEREFAWGTAAITRAGVKTNDGGWSTSGRYP